MWFKTIHGCHANIRYRSNATPPVSRLLTKEYPHSPNLENKNSARNPVLSRVSPSVKITEGAPARPNPLVRATRVALRQVVFYAISGGERSGRPLPRALQIRSGGRSAPWGAEAR